ncbi:Otu Domain-Containing Protein 7B [Manis pentadactyla]|nr:Otu Domain-Containing Protein 7B [Manis pentadactyla]
MSRGEEAELSSHQPTTCPILSLFLFLLVESSASQHGIGGLSADNPPIRYCTDETEETLVLAFSATLYGTSSEIGGDGRPSGTGSDPQEPSRSLTGPCCGQLKQ